MDITPQKITVRQLAEGFREGGYDEGVVGYGGNLDIRPPYQREFVYEGDDQKAVIKTALNNYPLNVMYWADNGGGKYEVLDGQQRTISLCRFVQPVGFSIDYNGKPHIFSGLPEDVRAALLNYELLVYFCRGNPSEKLEWFQIINIAGKELSTQEIRNAVYCGTWVASAKKHFSRPGSGAAVIADGYYKEDTKRRVNRQWLLEKAMKWVWNIRTDAEICSRMNQERDKPNADELRQEFKAIIDWAAETFPSPATYKKEMPFVDWGELYHAHRDKQFDAVAIAERIKQLMADEDITSRKGIFAYVLDDDVSHLFIRAFDADVKSVVWEKQGRKCGYCKAPISDKCTREAELPLDQAHADHYDSWRDGGKTEIENCVVACRHCNLAKGAK